MTYSFQISQDFMYHESSEMPRGFVSKGSCSWIVQVILIMLLLFILLILLLPRSHESLWETFTTGPGTGVSSINTFQRYNNADSSIEVKMDAFDADLINLSRTFSDQNALLQAKRCYQFDYANYDLFQTVIQLIYKSKVPIMGKSFVHKTGEENKITIESTILSLISDFKKDIGGVKVSGPVFVILSQTPFHRNSDCGMMPIQYSIADYFFKPTNRSVEDTHKCDANGKPYFQTQVACIFPAYEKSGTIVMRTIPESQRTSKEKRHAYLEKLVIDIMKNREVVKDYCFIECVDDSTLMCGCLSSDKNPHSLCLAPRREPKTKFDRTNSFKSDFWMLYSVNKHYHKIASQKLM